jgi:hypothetical protein
MPHPLVSASNGHMTRFLARKGPSDALSVLAPGDAKPTAAGPDDNADGEAEDDAPAVSSFDSSASISGVGAGGRGEIPPTTWVVRRMA